MHMSRINVRDWFMVSLRTGSIGGCLCIMVQRFSKVERWKLFSKQWKARRTDGCFAVHLLLIAFTWHCAREGTHKRRRNEKEGVLGSQIHTNWSSKTQVSGVSKVCVTYCFTFVWSREVEKLTYKLYRSCPFYAAYLLLHRKYFQLVAEFWCYNWSSGVQDYTTLRSSYLIIIL